MAEDTKKQKEGQVPEQPEGNEEEPVYHDINQGGRAEEQPEQPTPSEEEEQS